MKQFCSPEILKKTILSALAAGAIIAFFRIYFMGKYELCVDSFYHVTIADLGYEFYTAKTFPHMTMSIWRGCFSDKELLFHFLLSIIRGIEGLFRYNDTPPYHFPAIVFSLCFLFAFAFSATCLGVKRVYLFSILLVLTSPFFTYRLGMLRPHVFGLSIILLSLPLFRYAKSFLGYLGIFFISLVYAWSYSHPHFILFPALAFSISRWCKNKKICVYLVASGLLGILCGYTIHPQFPNTFIIWKVQCVDLPIQLLFSNIPVYVWRRIISS